MLITKMLKFIYNLIFLYFFASTNVFAGSDFNSWLKNFKIRAINSGISEKVVNDVMTGAKFLPKVIEYDRFQPEFYEDTFTYIKRIV